MAGFRSNIKRFTDNVKRRLFTSATELRSTHSPQRKPRRKITAKMINRQMTVGGWTKREQVRWLMRQAESLPDYSTIVEVGVWQGRSALALGEACRGTHKRVYAIDPWQEYETMQGPLDTRLDEFGVDSIESVYEIFLANRQRLGLEQWVEPIRTTSLEAATKWAHGECAFIFVDGDHHYESVLSDLRAWTKLTQKGGMVCGDDWDIDVVRQAVEDFGADRSGFSIERPCPNTWAFRV